MRDHSCDICIIGGGIAGSITGIELAEKGYSVVILEKKSHILEGTSNVTPGRMGLGFHYVHEETATMYLRSSIEFVKKYQSKVKNLRIGEDKPLDHYLRRGRYFITKDSLFSVDHILRTYETLKTLYKQLCEEDQTNQVFGDPELFYTQLKPADYENLVDTEKVVLGIETAEHLLNWANFKTYLCETINNHSNIKVLTSNDAIRFEHDLDKEKHIVISKDEENIVYKKNKITADYVINCAWENVEYLTVKAGLTYPDKTGKTHPDKAPTRTNRLKILVAAKLPNRLKSKNSMFFCMGPHCMFSNMGNGVGYMTYAKVTNFMNSNAVTVPNKISAYLNYHGGNEADNDVEETARSKGNDIINGVAEYIPAMKGAEIIDVRFGVVITKGGVNIYDHKSSFHQRNYSGVDDKFPIGWINNSSMKLLYGYNNAQAVVKIIQNQEEIRKNLHKNYTQYFVPGNKIKSKAILKTVLKYFDSSELTSEKIETLKHDMEKIVEVKTAATTLLNHAGIFNNSLPSSPILTKKENHSLTL